MFDEVNNIGSYYVAEFTNCLIHADAESMRETHSALHSCGPLSASRPRYFCTLHLGYNAGPSARIPDWIWIVVTLQQSASPGFPLQPRAWSWRFLLRAGLHGGAGHPSLGYRLCGRMEAVQTAIPGDAEVRLSGLLLDGAARASSSPFHGSEET
jgi:hypothetical protein